jgi:WD40 repeat protein
MTVPHLPAAAPDAAWPHVPGYEILGELGRGGMGVVYKARQASLGRVVALKVLLTGNLASAAERERFRREAEAVAKLQHPGVVQVFEVGESDGRPFLSLEFCGGGSLAGRLDGTPLVPKEAARIVRELAGAVQALHQAGLIHRDLKPSNVLLQTTEDTEHTEKSKEKGSSSVVSVSSVVPKIADFGLAKELGSPGQTASGAVVGTPSYMAPEQAAARHGEVGPATDVYALGAILYELLTGRPPFRAATALDTVMQVLKEEPVPPTRLQPKTPRDLESICLKCLEKQPARRYAKAKELADDLGRFAGGEPVRARPVGRLTRGWRWCRRNPAVAGLLLAVGLALLLGAGVASAFALMADDKARKEAAARKDADENARRATENAREAARRLYISDLRLVQQAWEQGNYDRARELLEGQRPEHTGGEDLRHFEWYYWQRCLDFPLRTLTVCDPEQGGMAYDLAVSPDGGVLAVRCQQRGAKSVIKLFDTADWHETASFSGQAGFEPSMAFSPDGKRLLCGQINGTIDVWDTVTKTSEHSFRAGSQAKHYSPCAFSRDGERVAYSGKAGEMTVFRVETGMPITRFTKHRGVISGVDFSPDGRRIASSDDSPNKEIKVWDAETGEVVQTLTGSDRPVICVKYSTDGKHIASADAFAEGSVASVSLWEAETGRKIRAFSGGQSKRIFPIAFSPDGALLVGACDDMTTRVWDVATGAVVRTFKKVHPAVVRDVAFSPDGSRVYTVSQDCTVTVWDATKGQESLPLTDGSGPVACLALSPDGERVAGMWQGPESRTELWDARTGHSLRSFQPPPTGGNRLAFSPDGEKIARGGSGGGPITLLDAETGRELQAIKGQFNIWSIAWSPDGRTFAVGNLTYDFLDQKNDHAVSLWDAVSGQHLRTWRSDQQGSHSVTFSPEGKRLARLGGKAVTIWDVATGEELLTIQDSDAAWGGAVAFMPDGKRLIGAVGKDLKIWDVSDGRVVKVLKGPPQSVEHLAVSQDGRRVVSGGGNRSFALSSTVDPYAVRVWDADSGQEVIALTGHTRPITGVAISPDGMRIVSSSLDKSLRLWDATPRESDP